MMLLVALLRTNNTCNFFSFVADEDLCGCSVLPPTTSSSIAIKTAQYEPQTSVRLCYANMVCNTSVWNCMIRIVISVSVGS